MKNVQAPMKFKMGQFNGIQISLLNITKNVN